MHVHVAPKYSTRLKLLHHVTRKLKDWLKILSLTGVKGTMMLLV